MLVGRSMKHIMAIAAKELRGYFNSAVALLFLATFLVAVMLFFFFVERFFARNIADVRPLFDWMPVLLIFLIAAMTMRLWSEERRSGGEKRKVWRGIWTSCCRAAGACAKFRSLRFARNLADRLQIVRRKKH